MEETSHLNDQCLISGSLHLADNRTQVLKQADTFAVLDRLGVIGAVGLGEHGVYHRGTRHLSRWELSVNGRHPLLLNSTMRKDNSVLIVEFTTPDIEEGTPTAIQKGAVHLFRSLVLNDGALYEHLRITNYSSSVVTMEIGYIFSADFVDLFEVRGMERARRGQILPPHIEEQQVTLGYLGLDHVRRETRIVFSGDLTHLSRNHVLFRCRLKPGEAKSYDATIACRQNSEEFHITSHADAAAHLQNVIAKENESCTRISTSNEAFDRWLNQSIADLQMLSTDTPYGRFPYAGVPWFSTPFGRDGLITALQMLWVQPRLAQGVLSFLAATQATQCDPSVDAEPGKIVHEIREGEMAALGEIPFRRYYGTVDATPLFVILAGRYFDRTGDLKFIESIWDHIKRAIQWINEWGDSDGDGFVEYQRHNSRGLVQQGWKDSDNSIFHADGSPAKGPIALCEVQAYVYEAKQAAAHLARRLGDTDLSDQLLQEASELQRRFHDAFWVESLQTYAIALDGDKRRCEVRNSNAGHALACGIVPQSHAEPLVKTLLDERSCTCWGIRTIAEGEANYNPMSYHNGSVWPHDTAFVGMGFARYGFRQEAVQLLTGLFEAASFLDLARLPELFCGFERLPGHAPTLYPVACSPQAWAAGSGFMLLQACLGLSFSAERPQIRFDHPVLPSYLSFLTIHNLRIGDGVADLTLRRHPQDVGVNVTRKEGDFDIVIYA